SAVWTEPEEDALLKFLVEHQAEAGDGGNFKKATFENSAASIAHLHQRGAVKTYKTCQNKWSAMIFCVICTLQKVSGWTWDNKTGASITPETASSWDDYVHHHPDAKPFCNRGWCHLSMVTELMPSTVSGTNV
ncbi:hypothetical protein FA15DRAFT_571423, partial [Coprinopsis marcescibilis]